MSYEDETQLMLAVRGGDIDGLVRFFHSYEAQGMAVGDFSENEFRHLSTLFICVITLFTRAAIEGGLSQELAYDLSDAYLNCMYRIDCAQEISQLFFIAALDFAKRVRQSAVSRSLPVKRCCEYISSHLHDRITLGALSQASGLSVSRLSACFHAQIGLPPAEYIIREKLEAARKLLLATDRPISDIAAQFGFCSHSNFSLHFRRAYGMPPFEYRSGNYSK